MRRLKNLAKKLNADVDNDSMHCVYVGAPTGYRWHEGPHALVGTKWMGKLEKDDEQDLIDRMILGVEKCESGCECEWDKNENG